MKRFCLLLLVSLAIPPETFACAVESGFTHEFRKNPNGTPNFIGNFNDYGRIHFDAENPQCAFIAMHALTDKLENHMWIDPVTRTTPRAGAFSSWLDGYAVALIYAAAMRLGAFGWANKDLNQLLLTQPGLHPGLDSFFAHGSDPSDPCGYNTFNTCMDDNTGTAAAYAWMAAYKKRRMQALDPQTGPQVLARNRIRAAMADVCLWQPHTEAGGALCLPDRAAALNALEICQTTNPSAQCPVQTLSVNRGQNIHYGFGLMTSIASAYLGLREAGAAVTFERNERLVATGLFAEARKHVSAYPMMGFTAEYRRNCLSGNVVNGHHRTDDHCGGGGPPPPEPQIPNPYHPNMYQLENFYIAASLPIPPFPLIPERPDDFYSSNSFDESKFNNEEHSYGRLVTYGDHGFRWVQNRPDFMPHDFHDPIGFFEGISATGMAQGWTCDRDTREISDATNRGIWVDFYVDGNPFTAVAQGFANSPSEAEINGPQWCQSGTAHRFWVQLPESTKGKTIKAWGLDYTWYGATELGCLQTPRCAW